METRNEPRADIYSYHHSVVNWLTRKAQYNPANRAFFIVKELARTIRQILLT